MKNNKGFAPVLIILAVLAVLAVGGVAYYAGKNSDNVAPQNIEDNNTNNPVVNSETFKITFPTAGAILVEGNTYTITWVSDAPNITYGLYLENDQAGSIRIGETSQGSFSWTVPSILSYTSTADNYSGAPAPTDGYRISFTSGTSIKDMKQYLSPVFKIIPKN